MDNKNLPTVIKYEGDNSTFVHRFGQTDFYFGSVLIVHESQEAVFFSSGEALDSFGPGSYPIETENLPFVSRFFNRVAGDKSPFHCEIYFINKTEQLGIKWGTDSKLEFVEPTYGFPIQIGASGEMSLRVDDGRKLLMKVVGTERDLSQQQFVQKMRAFLLMRLKPYLAWVIRENKLSIFEIDEHLAGMSEAVRESLEQDFVDYGVVLEKFMITTIMKPEDDKNYQRFKDLHFRQYADVAEAKLRQQVDVIDQQTAAQRMVIEAEGLSQKRRLEGYTYQDERGFDVAEKVAANEAVGQLGNVGIGMGMISGVGGAIGGKVGGIVESALDRAVSPVAAPAETPSAPASVVTESTCAACGTTVPPGARFCPECGAAQPCKCPSCGKVPPQGARFCPECGEALK